MWKVVPIRELKPALAVILGTRPEIIKLAPVLRALRKSTLRAFVIYTGQHYSPSLGSEIFQDLRLPAPEWNHFQCKSRHHGEQTGMMLCHVERVLLEERPRWVLVQGDVNSTLAGALAAKKLGMQVAHLEAGLRSFDPRMPEEHNRIMVDHISDLLFAPTPAAARQLLRENVRGTVHMVGNTIVDSVLANRQRARKSKILVRLGLQPDQPFFLFTLHRQENLENPENLHLLAEILRRVLQEFRLPIVFPIHPGTQHRLEHAKQLSGLRQLPALKLIPPLRYLDFLRLLETCRLVFTDSGGVQEEACILKVPAVTLRESTERPETLEVGSNELAGLDPEHVLCAAWRMLCQPRHWVNPFGDGRTGIRVVRILKQEMERGILATASPHMPVDKVRGDLQQAFWSACARQEASLP